MVLPFLGAVAKAAFVAYPAYSIIQSIAQSCYHTSTSRAQTTTAIEAATTIFLTSKLKPILNVTKAFKQFPRKSHTSAFVAPAPHSTEVFRKAAWQGDSVMNLLTTQYLLSKYPNMPLKGLQVR